MKKIIVLIGPTGVGKTGTSILLAKALNTEIISSDSMQIYKYMDIGTAKSSPEERQIVKHQMIDIANPWEFFSTGEYIKIVKPIIENLHRRNKIPIIVGGTGLYIKAMTRGIFEGPSSDWQLREDLKRKETDDPGYLCNYLKAIDPVSAGRIMPNDHRRIIRAIEVFLKGNTLISELHQTQNNPFSFDFIKIGLTRNREELYGIIEDRVDGMMSDGLLDEVKKVISMISMHCNGSINHLPALQAIGYKELALHLDGLISLDEAAALIKKKTRNYAKRQFTWFKKEEDVRWIDITGIHDDQKILEKVLFTIADRL